MNQEREASQQGKILLDAVGNLTQPKGVYVNVNEAVILTTEDKVRLCLYKHLSVVEQRRAWIAPLGILVTLLLCFVTSSFRDWFLPRDTWRAAFIILAALCLAWLVRCLLLLRSKSSIEDIVRELKKERLPLS